MTELIEKLYEWSELHCDADLTRADCEKIVTYLFSINSSSGEGRTLGTNEQPEEVFRSYCGARHLGSWCYSCEEKDLCTAYHD